MPTFVVGKGLRDIMYGDVKFTRRNRGGRLKEVSGRCGAGGRGSRGVAVKGLIYAHAHLTQQANLGALQFPDQFSIIL